MSQCRIVFGKDNEINLCWDEENIKEFIQDAAANGKEWVTVSFGSWSTDINLKNVQYISWTDLETVDEDSE